MTLDIPTIKSIAQLDDTHDEYLKVMCPLILERAEEYCHNKFEDIPAGVQLFIAECIKYNLTVVSGLSARGMGTVSYTYDLEFPEKIYKLIKTYRKVGFRRV